VTAAEPAVRCRGLVERYADVVAVDGLDLEVARGECFGLLGPNGAGKTTCIEILEGLLAPDAGGVHVLGRRWPTDASWLRSHLGIQFQETQLADKLTSRRRCGSSARSTPIPRRADDGARSAIAPSALRWEHRRRSWPRWTRSTWSSSASSQTTSHPSDADLAVLPGVRAVRHEGDTVSLGASEVHRTVPALLALLRERDLALSLLTTHSATQEDVFVTLTGRHLRDGQ
jgi:ABC-type sugar transport system ATPase subunit